MITNTNTVVKRLQGVFEKNLNIKLFVSERPFRKM